MPELAKKVVKAFHSQPENESPELGQAAQWRERAAVMEHAVKGVGWRVSLKNPQKSLTHRQAASYPQRASPQNTTSPVNSPHPFLSSPS